MEVFRHVASTPQLRALYPRAHNHDSPCAIQPTILPARHTFTSNKPEVLSLCVVIEMGFCRICLYGFFARSMNQRLPTGAGQMMGQTRICRGVRGYRAHIMPNHFGLSGFNKTSHTCVIDSDSRLQCETKIVSRILIYYMYSGRHLT